MRRVLAVVTLAGRPFGRVGDVALARDQADYPPCSASGWKFNWTIPTPRWSRRKRIVPLVKGVNQVDFSWANTQIDPNTIVFRVIPRAEPAGEKQREGQGRSQAARRESPFRELSAQRGGPSCGRSPPTIPVLRAVRISYLLGN